MEQVRVYAPPGYGLHLFGMVLPFPPAPALWALAALDVGAAIWAWRHPGRWWVFAAGLVVSAYLTYVGIFSIGPLYFALLWVQAGWLLVHAVRARRRRS